ncbi:MAG: hypothetical protein RLN89_05925 [Parvibaculum sp.]
MNANRIHNLSLAAALSFALALPVLPAGLFDAEPAANASVAAETASNRTKNNNRAAFGTAFEMNANNEPW